MDIQRAWSTLQLKAVDDGEGIITGIASTPSTDRVGDIVEPKGAQFKLPLPLLWQHNSAQPIGHITHAKVTADGIEIVGRVVRGVTDEIDRAWKLIRAGLVRGLSIGFRGMDVEQIPNSYGVRFKRWEWLELSAVTIPANADASIQTVKAADLSAPMGADVVRIAPLPRSSGRYAVPLNFPEKEQQ